MTNREQAMVERLMVLAIKHAPSGHKDNIEIKDLIDEYFTYIRKDIDKERK